MKFTFIEVVEAGERGHEERTILVGCKATEENIDKLRKVFGEDLEIKII